MTTQITKLLIANRGDIAVRIIRTCREMGIKTIALYESSDVGSLHVRRADEVVQIDSPRDFTNPELILRIAHERGAQAIHPGIGFLAEDGTFARACLNAGIILIAPPAPVIESTHDKIRTLERVAAAGFPTTLHTSVNFTPEEFEDLRVEADALGYPLIIKSNWGGRGPGQHLVRKPDQLAEQVRRAQAESVTFYGDPRVYLERAITPAHQIGVQIVGDNRGTLIHLGEREGSLLHGNEKILEEQPAPCLNQQQRDALWRTAIEIARLVDFQNVGTFEFLVDEKGSFFFTEIKARIQTEHPLPEIITRFDLVAEQIRLALGMPLGMTQEDVILRGNAMMCRITAEDPTNRSQASPGQLRRVRASGGIGTRTDTYVYGGCAVPLAYNPMIAKIATYAPDRATCLKRMARALEETTLIGTPTNLPLIERALASEAFQTGQYSTETRINLTNEELDEAYYRDLAVAVAIYHARRSSELRPEQPRRTQTGWHHSSRKLPE